MLDGLDEDERIGEETLIPHFGPRESFASCVTVSLTVSGVDCSLRALRPASGPLAISSDMHTESSSSFLSWPKKTFHADAGNNPPSHGPSRFIKSLLSDRASYFGRSPCLAALRTSSGVRCGWDGVVALCWLQ
jgi:hypothetical protein